MYHFAQKYNFHFPLRRLVIFASGNCFEVPLCVFKCGLFAWARGGCGVMQ